MRFAVCGLIVGLAVGLTGCGGGGGGGGSASLTDVPPGIVGFGQVPSDVVGTWKVPGLGLPADQMGVQPDGDVVVNSESPATRADSQAKIGACSPQGALTLNGTWRSGGVDYQISATGNVVPASHSLTLNADVTASNGDAHHNALFSGDRISDIELPPPPPFDPPANPGDEYPPPPPDGWPGDELPPPPPAFS
jgi:hypothetical protein